MRINNSNIKKVAVSVYFFLIVFNLVFMIIFNAVSETPISHLVLFVTLVFVFFALFMLLYGTAKFFEYDSDGLKVSVINKGLLATNYLNSKDHIIEFEKKNLRSFKFHNFIIYKQLELFIINRHGHKKKEIFNVTLVGRKKCKYIKQSLNKIIKNNRKQKNS